MPQPPPSPPILGVLQGPTAGNGGCLQMLARPRSTEQLKAGVLYPEWLFWAIWGRKALVFQHLQRQQGSPSSSRRPGAMEASRAPPDTPPLFLPHPLGTAWSPGQRPFPPGLPHPFLVLALLPWKVPNDSRPIISASLGVLILLKGIYTTPAENLIYGNLPLCLALS